MIFGFDLTLLEYWHWWVVAGVCFVLEVLVMGFFFLWFGVSAVIVGAVTMMVPALSWQIQGVLWAVLAVIGALGWRVYQKKHPNTFETDEPFLNKRGGQYVGRVFALEEPIVNGFGKIRVDDSHWKVSCPQDLPAGAKIRVTGLKDTTFEAVPER